MHFLKKLSYILIISLGTLGSLAAEPEPATPATPELSQEQIAEIIHLFESVPQQTHRLRLILTAIVQKCEPALLKNIKHGEVRSWALDMQQFLKSVQDIPGTTPDVMFIKAHANKYCAKLIQENLNSQLLQTGSFSREACHKNLLEETGQIDRLFLMEAETATLLKELEPKVKNLGLTMGNRAARSAEMLWNDYKIANKLSWLALLTALTYGGKYMFDAYKMGPEVFQENTLMTAFGKNLLGSSLGYMGSALATTAIASSYSMFAKAKNNTTQLIANQWNRLKGTETILDASGYQAIDDNTITFESPELIGLEEQVKDIQPILDCCKDLDDFVRRGNKPQYGTLLIGPSGCGKTMFSRALAGTIHELCKRGGQDTKVRFKELSVVDLLRATLRDHIADARKQGGVVVLFIDEIHNLAMQTTKNSFSLNDFLTQMADLYKTDVPNSYVFLVAATNQPELLGTSLLVPGRFGKIIRFSYPSSTKRTELFKKLLPRAGVNIDDLDIPSLVRQTNETSFGTLRSLINEARIKAEGMGEIVGQKHLQATIDTIVHRFKHTIDLTPAEKKMIAAYQASKALSYLLLESNLNVERITIGGINDEVKEINEYSEREKPNPNKSTLYTPNYGAVITYRKQEALKADDILEQKKQCKALVAGSCGQDLLLNTHSATYNAPDMQQAMKIAQEIVLNGKLLEDLSRARQDEIRDQAEALVTAYQQEMLELLTKHKAALEALVAKLETDITLSGADAQSFLK